MKRRTTVTRGFLPIRSTSAALRPLKASESVARDIVDDIVVERLDEGDNLPAETAMLQQYGVSRETLREALRLLEVQGLISIRRGPGGGPIVGVVDPANLGRVSTLYYHLAGATYARAVRGVGDLRADHRRARRRQPGPRPTCARRWRRTSSCTGPRTSRSRSSSSATASSTRRRLAGPQQGAAAVADGDRPDRHPPRDQQRRPARRAQHHRARPQRDRPGDRQRLQGQGPPPDAASTSGRSRRSTRARSAPQMDDYIGWR